MSVDVLLNFKREALEEIDGYLSKTSLRHPYCVCRLLLGILARPYTKLRIND